ncbi:MAG: TetR/AcrR family transcriptional regulator [Gemmatimonadales bacterium]|nr:TetR/AcrR family transcriptional regulator [Gemmatimonadales bacterium]
MPTPRTLSERVAQQSRRRRHDEKEDLRREIIDAAGALLLQGGYDAFSMRRLAERIGYSATTIYRYFRDKEAVIHAVLREGFRRFGSALKAAESSSDDAMAQLEAECHAYVRFGLENPTFYRVMFVDCVDTLGRFEHGPDEEPFDASYQVLVRTVARVAARGFVPADRVEALSALLWAQVHGIVVMLLTMPGMPPQLGAMMTADNARLVRVALEAGALKDVRGGGHASPC